MKEISKTDARNFAKAASDFFMIISDVFKSNWFESRISFS